MIFLNFKKNIIFSLKNYINIDDKYIYNITYLRDLSFIIFNKICRSFYFYVSVYLIFN